MLLIKNGRLVDPKSDFDGRVDILIEDDKIVEIAESIEKAGAEVIDASGYKWIDLYSKSNESSVSKADFLESPIVKLS